MKISKEDLVKAIADYEECVSIFEIALGLGVSRQALWKAFRANGVETRKGIATRRVLVCDNCGQEYEVTRSRYKRLGKKKFCSDTCYFMYLGNGNSNHNRQVQRVSRAKVSEVFELGPENVVHHEDGNHWNTHFSNLKVFENNSEHIKYHHQKRQGNVTVEPIWDGSKKTEIDPYYSQVRSYSKAQQVGKKK